MEFSFDAQADYGAGLRLDHFTKLSEGISGIEAPSVEAGSIVVLTVSSSLSHSEFSFASSFFCSFYKSLSSAVSDVSAIDLWIFFHSSCVAVEFIAMSATNWMIGSTVAVPR